MQPSGSPCRGGDGCGCGRGIAAIGGLIYAIVNSVKADEQTARDEDTWYKQLQTGFAPTAIAVPDLGTLLASASGSVPDGPINNTAQ